LRQTVTDTQRAMALTILTTAIAILRDDQPFDPANTVFGRNLFTEPALGSAGNEYSFENPVLPATQITLLTEIDPTNSSANHQKAKAVPMVFTILFSPLMTGIARSTLEDLLPLDIGYWIDGDGNRRSGNDMGTAPPQVLLHHYRYRASIQPTSRFPVDVELVFGDPDPQDVAENAPRTPVLMDVILTRDYFKLTPNRTNRAPF